mmetsp:Transcript_16404/g.18812  ORF Transcript_16404/g.18812 Transcript_16404/m.18812 type:complete len:299 (-) Transcript_16404:141-1037(-)
MNFGSIQKLLFKPLVPLIKINGMIDSAQTTLVQKSLEQVNPKRSKALVVVVNSHGGSPTQTELIIEKIQSFCHEHHLKLYTFAEHSATSTSYNILASGDKVFVDTTSLVGSVGVASQWMGVNKFLERYKLRYRSFYSNDDLLSKKGSPFKDQLTDSDRQVFSDIVKDMDEHLLKEVEKFRGKKLTKEAGTKEALQQIWTGTKAQQLGLADQIGSYESVLYKEFPEARIVNVTVRNQFEKNLSRTKAVVKILTSRALVYFLIYWIIKTAIKIYLLILVYTKSKGEAKAVEGDKEKKSHH